MLKLQTGFSRDSGQKVRSRFATRTGTCLVAALLLFAALEGLAHDHGAFDAHGQHDCTLCHGQQATLSVVSPVGTSGLVLTGWIAVPSTRPAAATAPRLTPPLRGPPFN